MGGGGGTFSGDYSPEKYKEILRDVQRQSRNASFEAELNELVNNLLSEYARDTDRTREHMASIKDSLEDEIEGSLDMLFGGSVKKYTYVHGLSDIDVLLMVDKSELAEYSPSEIMEYISDKLIHSRVQGLVEIKVGDLAVTAKFNDGEQIQLLPALKQGTGYKIPSLTSNTWSKIIHPDRFIKKLTEVNQRNGGKVVPVVKLAKDVIYRLPEDQQLNGYHIESLAVEIFKRYPDNEPRVPRVMLKYFFEKAKDQVRSPLMDKTGQSLHVDDYLGDADSTKRIRISYTLDRVYKRMKIADNVGSIEEWRSILGVE